MRIAALLLLAWIALTLTAPRLPAVPESPATSHYRAGMAAKQTGRLAASVDHFRAALQADPNHSDSLWALAWVLAHQGDRAASVACFQQFLGQAHPDDGRRELARETLRRFGVSLPPLPEPEPFTDLAAGRIVGRVSRVDGATGVVVIAVERAAGAERAGPRRVLVSTGRPGLAVADDGAAGQVALELAPVGCRAVVSYEPAERGASATGPRPLRRLRLLVDAATPRLPPVRFSYTGLLDERGADLPLVFPILGGVPWRDNYREPRPEHPHFGIDLGAPKMTPLVAPFDGVVVLRKSARWPGDSFTVVIDNAAGWSALYTHLNHDTPGSRDRAGGDRYAFAPGLRQGDRVVAGQLLGWVGDSGNATAPHLHLELRSPTGELRNPAPALREARVRHEPQPAPLAPGVLPGPGRVRLDGYLAAARQDLAEAALDLRARTGPGGGATAFAQPTRRWFGGLPAALPVLGLPGVAVPLSAVPHGTFLLLLGDLDRPGALVEQVAVAPAAVWLE